MPKISILGCGWLGLPLAKTLIEKGYAVSGSTTTNAKIPALKETGIDPHLLTVNADAIDGDIEPFLKNCDTLIIDFPPKLRAGASESFVSKIRALIPYIENNHVANVIFISSISVYGDSEMLVTEDTIPNPMTESGRQLCEAEGFLMQHDFTTTIVRFGGLTGDERHPVHHLAGKDNLSHPDAPINLIHQSDCIGILVHIIEAGITNEVFNAVAPFHPARKEYYEAKAAAMNLEKPIFSSDVSQSGKTVSSDKLERVLGYQFLVTAGI